MTGSCTPMIRFPGFMDPWKPTPISTLLERQSIPVEVDLVQTYRQIGVRSHGKGIFHKEHVTGAELGDKRVFRVVPGALVVNIVFAWEQAVALTTDAEAGFVASHRFPMFTEKDGKSYLPFLRHMFLTKRGKVLLEMASPGGAGRNKTLGQQEFLKLKPLVPSRSEQKKIADAIDAVDAKVAAMDVKVSALAQFKAGLMHKLFSQELRFTQDDGKAFPDWDVRDLRNIAVRSVEKNKNLQTKRVLTNSAVHGVIDQRDFFEKDIANSESLGGYYVVKRGDFVYNPRISVSAPVGPIKRNDLGDGVMSPLYSVFRFYEGNTDFFEQYFRTALWHDYMKSVANFGARHDRMAITIGDLMGLPMPFPHPDEQQKIANVLSTMDAKIQALVDQVTGLQTFKNGLLQQLFA